MGIEHLGCTYLAVMCINVGTYSSRYRTNTSTIHMAQKPVLQGEVGCVCVAREVGVAGVGERGCASAGVQGAWVGGCGCEAD